jgi:KaiC/GvpD/RAD55 family RecA-like ATPase
MRKMMINEVELAERWNLSLKTLQRWRSGGRGPRFMKMSKRVVYPMDEVFDFESQALRASTWESAGDGVRSNGSNLMDPREIARVTGLPLYIFSHKQTRDSLGVPHRRVQKLIRFDRNEVMAWARRWLQDAKDQGIDAKADPAGQYRSLQQALASLPA